MDRVIVFVLMGILLVACGGQEVEKAYHANGKVKYRLQKKNGKLDGTVEEYYASGQIKYRSEWSEGVSNGVVEQFFENGHLQSRQYYAHGKQVGRDEAYFDNGNLSFSANYQDGKMTGVSSSYYKHGVIEERTTYDTLGNVIHNAHFSPEGYRIRSYMLPQVELLKDTLWAGEQAVVTIRFPLAASGKIAINGIEEGPEEGSWPVGDNLQQKELSLGKIAQCTAMDTVVFIRRYYSPGTYQVTMHFDHTRMVPADTLSVKGVKKSYTVFVRGRSVGL